MPGSALLNVEPKRRSWDWAARNASPGVRDAQPLADTAQFWRAVAQAATIVMAVIMFGVLLYLARSLLVPILSALVVSLTLGPIAARGARFGLPTWVPALLIVAIFVACLYTAVVMLSEPASDLIGRSQEIGTAIREKFRFMDRPLTALRELQMAIAGSSGVSVDMSQSSILASVMSALPPFALQLVLFLATLFFFVFGRNAMRRYVVNVFGTRDGRLRALRIVNDIEANLSSYLITVTIINLCVGMVATLVTWALGFPTPLLWGALAFVLNYIPYVGAGIMHVILFVIGLLTFDTLWPALIAPLFFMAFTFVEGHFIVPNVVGRQLLLHPLAVFLSLAFWAWLWGPIGALLATPILIVAMVSIDHLYPRGTKVLPG
jgi:predicted PurR-regulated permease PerM